MYQSILEIFSYEKTTEVGGFLLLIEITFTAYAFFGGVPSALPKMASI